MMMVAVVVAVGRLRRVVMSWWMFQVADGVCDRKYGEKQNPFEGDIEVNMVWEG